MRRPPPYPGRTFRTIAEQRMVDHLVLCGHVHEVRAGREDEARLAASRALDRWTRAGLGFARGAAGERLFDPAEVTNHFVRAGMLGEDDFWATRFIAGWRRLLREQQRLSEGDCAGAPPIAALPPRRFRVRLERDFELPAGTAGGPMRLRLPAPLADEATRDLRCEAAPLSGCSATRLDASFDWRVAAGGERSRTVSLDASLTALPHAGTSTEFSPVQRDLYTRTVEGFIHVTPEIRDACAGALGDAPSRGFDTASTLFELICSRFQCGAIQYGDLDPQAPLAGVWAHGWADCQLASALFCAMCRAAGVPARVVSGYPLHPVMPAHHYWAQAWSDEQGWRDFDFLDWVLSRGGEDAGWRGVFQGALDYRMTLQVFPRLFTGAGSVRFPRWWHMVCRAVPGGVEMAYEDACDGSLVYRDRVFVVESDDTAQP